MSDVILSVTPARYVPFRVGAARLGLPIEEVVRVLRVAPVTRVPRAPACVEGVINVEHEIVPVIDLACRLGLPPAPGRAEDERVVLVAVSGQTIGLHVAEVGAALWLDDRRGLPPEGELGGLDPSLLLGAGYDGAGLLWLLNAARLPLTAGDVVPAAPDVILKHQPARGEN
jgi:purine-binding chemotaxis protein CheW